MTLEENKLYTGCVKWFNKKTGYGFITLIDNSEPNAEIFVHHSALDVPNDIYKYLIQGEYVTFFLSKSEKHLFTANKVKGIDRRFLLCQQTTYSKR
jgi:cold shock CspA family protein